MRGHVWRVIRGHRVRVKSPANRRQVTGKTPAGRVMTPLEIAGPHLNPRFEVIPWPPAKSPANRRQDPDDPRLMTLMTLPS